MAVLSVKANTPVRIIATKSVTNAEHPDGSWLLTKHHIKLLNNNSELLADLGYYDGPVENGHSIAFSIPVCEEDVLIDVTTYFRLSPAILPISDEQVLNDAEIALPFQISQKQSVDMVWHRASFTKSKYSVEPFSYQPNSAEKLSEKVSDGKIRVAIEEEYVVGYQSGNNVLNYDAITLELSDAVEPLSRAVSPTVNFASAYEGYTNPYEYIASIEGNTIDQSGLPTPPLPDGPWGGYGAGANKPSTIPTDFAADDATKLRICNLLGFLNVTAATTKQVAAKTGVVYAISGSLKVIPVSAVTNVLTALTCSGAVNTPKVAQVFDFRQSSYYHPSPNPAFQTEIDLWAAIWDLGLLPGYTRNWGGKPQALFADEWATRTALCRAFGYLNYLGGMHGTNRNPGDDYLFYYVNSKFLPYGARSLNRKIQGLRCAGKPVSVVVEPTPVVPIGTLPIKPTTGAFVDTFPDNALRDLVTRPPQIGLAWNKYVSHVVPSVSPTWSGVTPLTNTTSLVAAGAKTTISGNNGFEYSPLYVSDFAELRNGYFGVGCYSMYLEYVHTNTNANTNVGFEICLYTRDVNGVGAPGIILSFEFLSPSNEIRVTGYYRAGTGDLDAYSDQEYVKIPITVDGLYEIKIPAIVGTNPIDVSVKNYEPPRGNHWTNIILQVNYVDLVLNVPYYNIYNNNPPGIRLRRSSGEDLGSTPFPMIANYYVYDVSSNVVGTAPELAGSSFNYSDSVSTVDTFARTGILAPYAAHSWQGPHWKDAIGSSALQTVNSANELVLPDYNFAIASANVPYYFSDVLANSLNLSLFGTRTLFNAKAVANVSYLATDGVAGVATRVTQAAGGEFRSVANNVGYAAIINHSGLIKLIEYRGNKSALLGSAQVTGTSLGRISLLASDEQYVHQIKFKNTPDGGTYTINGVQVNWNASSATIRAALEQVYGSGAVTVTGSMLTSSGVFISFLDEVVSSLTLDTSGLYRYAAGSNTGYVNPTNVVDSLDRNALWYEADNALGRDGFPAIIDNTGGYIPSNSGVPDSLEFNRFGFNLPERVTVDGLEVRVRLKLVSGDIRYANVNIKNGTTDVGQNLVATNAIWPVDATDFTVGGSTSKFGLNAIDRGFLFHDDFKLKLTAVTGTGVGELDSLEAKVYYREKLPVRIIRSRAITKVPQRLAVTWNYKTVIAKTFPFTNQITNLVDSTGLDQGHVGVIGNKARFSYFEVDYPNQNNALALLGPFTLSAHGGDLGVQYFYGDSMQLPGYYIDATGSVPFLGNIDADLDEFTLDATGTSTPPGVRRSTRKRLLLAGFVSDFSATISPPEFKMDVNALIQPFDTKTGDPLSRVSYAVLVTDEYSPKVDNSSISDVLSRAGTGRSGNCANIVELVGGELVLATAFQPDATTFRGNYYYNVVTNQLFKKIAGKNAVAYWKNVSQ